jgi:hypothetical protein
VLEVFGLAEQGSRRISVGQIQGSNCQAPAYLAVSSSVDAGTGAVGLKMAMRLSEKDRAGLEALVEVRAAGKGGG